MRRLFSAFAAFWLFATPASALVWPNAVERVERRLESRDPLVRRQGAQQLARLPASAARRLALRALEDRDIEVKLTAAEVAVSLELEGLGDRVVGWLSDSEVRVRRAAADVLRHSPTARAIAPLGRVLGDPDPEVRAAVAAALGASRVPQAVVPLLGHLDDPRPEVRRAVVSALAQLRDARAVVPLIGKVQDAREDVRQSVARALGELGDPRAAAALMLALRDRDEGVRIAAVEALGQLRAEEATLALVALLGEDRRPPVQRATLEALAVIPSDAAREALVGELGRTDPHEQALVLSAVVGGGEPMAKRLVSCLAGQPSPELGDGCSLALGRMHAPDSHAAITDAMRRGVVRAQAGLEALAELGDARALPAVLEHLFATDPFVRRAAVDAVARLLDPRQPDGRAVEPIARALEAARDSRGERAALVALLGRTGSPRAAKLLMPIARDSDDLVLKLASVTALGQLGRAGQDAVLIDALDDERARVRLAAAVALRRTASGAAARILLDLLEQAAEQDRGALSIALVGALAGVQDPQMVARAERLMLASTDGGRDALIEAVGAAPGGLGSAPLVRLARRSDIASRAKVAEALVTHPEAVSTLVELVRDPDGSVRANAIWALGAVARAADLPVLVAGVGDRDVAAAGNAAAALGLAASRGLPAAAGLCKALGDTRSYVRANALAALALARHRCDPERERRLLSRDGSEVVRVAAARLLHAAPAEPKDRDQTALRQCAAQDRNGSVALACAEAPPPRRNQSEPVLAFVVPVGEAEPVARAPFALVRSDGLMRLGLSDRRGAVYEAAAPRGDVRLAVPAPLAR